MGSLCDFDAMSRANDLAEESLHRVLRMIHHEGRSLYDVDFDIEELKSVTLEFVLRDSAGDEKRIEVPFIVDPDDERLWQDEEDGEEDDDELPALPEDCCPFCGSDSCLWDCPESRGEEDDGETENEDDLL